MDKMIADAETMIASINAERPTAAARLWTAKDEEGNVTKVRVYLDKGYIDIRAANKAHMETVGRNYFNAALAALAKTGYQRVYA